MNLNHSHISVESKTASKEVRVSLVLSAYNGREYITEQLDSLRQQSRAFDEVLIVDDASSDGTPGIVESYIEHYQLNNWNLTVNAQNKGWKTNFHDLLYHASGDYIFLCDQDDVWELCKVSDMTALMQLHHEIDLLACDVEPFYQEGSKRVPNVGNGANDGKVCIKSLDDKAVYVLRPGCAYCVRRSFLNEIAPYWDESWAHDAMLWELALVKGTLALYDRRLVKFRRHDGNASARKKMTKERRIADIEDLIDRVALMKRFGSDLGTMSVNDKSLLDALDSWLNFRLQFLSERDIGSLVRVVGEKSFYATWKGLIVDIALSVFTKLSL